MRILVTDELHECFALILTEAGHDLVFEPNRSKIERIIADFDVVVVRTSLKMDASLLQKAKNLKIIARAGSGLDHIDLQKAAELKIQVISSPEGNANAVAEHALSFLLCLMNKICSANNSVRSGGWNREHYRGRELEDLTVGVIGYGNTGNAFADKLLRLGVNVLAYDKYKHGFGAAEKTINRSAVREVSLETLLCHSQVISFHVPLTAETRYFLNDEFVESCKLKPYIINTSRGAVIDLSVLNRAITSGKILAAALDVLESEPPELLPASQKQAFEELLQSDNVIFSPHVAGWTIESKERIAKKLAEKIVRNS